MRDILNQILDDCPTHGHMSHTAHLAFCPNEDHKVIVDLIENYDEVTECSCITECECPDEVECPECGEKIDL